MSATAGQFRGGAAVDLLPAHRVSAEVRFKEWPQEELLPLFDLPNLSQLLIIGRSKAWAAPLSPSGPTILLIFMKIL